MADTPERDKVEIKPPEARDPGHHGRLMEAFTAAGTGTTAEVHNQVRKLDMPATPADGLQPLQIADSRRAAQPGAGSESPPQGLLPEQPQSRAATVPRTSENVISPAAPEQARSAADKIQPVLPAQPAVPDAPGGAIRQPVGATTFERPAPGVEQSIASASPLPPAVPMERLAPGVVPVPGNPPEQRSNLDVVARNPNPQPERPVVDSIIPSSPLGDRSGPQLEPPANIFVPGRQPNEERVEIDRSRSVPQEPSTSESQRRSGENNPPDNSRAESQLRPELANRSEPARSESTHPESTMRTEVAANPAPNQPVPKSDISLNASKNPSDLSTAQNVNAGSGMAGMAGLANFVGPRTVTESSRAPNESRIPSDGSKILDGKGISPAVDRDQRGNIRDTAGGAREIRDPSTEKSLSGLKITSDGKLPVDTKATAAGRPPADVKGPGEIGTGRTGPTTGRSELFPPRQETAITDGRKGAGAAGAGAPGGGPHSRTDMADLNTKTGKSPIPNVADRLADKIKSGPGSGIDGADGKGGIGIVGRFDNAKGSSKAELPPVKDRVQPTDGKGVSGFAANIAQSIRDKFSPGDKKAPPVDASGKKPETASESLNADKDKGEKTSEKDKNAPRSEGQESGAGLGRFLSDFARRALTGNRAEKDLPGAKTEILSDKNKKDTSDYLRNQKGDKIETLKLNGELVQLRQQELQAAQKNLADAKAQAARDADSTKAHAVSEQSDSSGADTVVTTPAEDAITERTAEPTMTIPADDEFLLTDEELDAKSEIDKNGDAARDPVELTEEEKRPKADEKRATYIVMEGDYLELVSTKLFANTSYVPLLKRLNQSMTILRQFIGVYSIEVDMLKPGEEILLPTKSEVAEFLRSI